MFHTYIASYPSEKVNQDRVAIATSEKSLIIALADGAGGFGDGAFVAQFIVDKAIEAFNERILVDSSECASLLARLDQLLIAHGEQGESTAVIVMVESNLVFGASVGDSGALLIGHDKSVIELTEYQRRKPLIGTGRSNPVAFGEIPMKGIIVVASDGLLKYTSMEMIVGVVAANAIDDVANRLVDLVRLRNKALFDDTTAAVYSP